MKRFAVMPQAFNMYSYAGNNPIIYIDPTGEFSIKGTIEFFEELEKINYAIGDFLTFGYYSEVVDGAKEAGERIHNEGVTFETVLNASEKVTIGTAKLFIPAAINGATIGEGSLLYNAISKKFLSRQLLNISRKSSSSKIVREIVGSKDDALKLFRNLIKEGSERVLDDAAEGSLRGVYKYDDSVQINFRPVSSKGDIPTIDLGNTGKVVDGIKKLKFVDK